jgi:hypothetical protein
MKLVVMADETTDYTDVTERIGSMMKWNSTLAVAVIGTTGSLKNLNLLLPWEKPLSAGTSADPHYSTAMRSDDTLVVGRRVIHGRASRHRP